MGKFVDLTGQKFGRLTVIERAENKGKQTCWLCKCECGNEKVVTGYCLKNGHTNSCGCLRKETTKKQGKKNIDDLKEQRFGRLTVIERTNTKCDSGDVYWLCKCDCGNTKEVKGISLKNGSTTSCGCFRSERLKKLNEEWWKNEDYRKRKSDLGKQLWENESFREQQVEKGKKLVGKFNPNYRGGITPISMHLRGTITNTKEWKRKTYIRENSKCQITGKHVHGGNSDVHHLKGFNIIVREAHDLHNIQIKEIVADYTEEELRLLEEYVASWHKDTSNAVLLSEDVHKLFHKLYGKGENTPEQFEEFKERYLAGEFKEILN